MVFQHLHFGLESPFCHRYHHPLDFFDQFLLTLWRQPGRPGYFQSDLVFFYPRRQDLFVNVSQLGLDLAGQVVWDGYAWDKI